MCVRGIYYIQPRRCTVSSGLINTSKLSPLAYPPTAPSLKSTAMSHMFQTLLLLYFSLFFKQFVFAAQTRARDGELCHHRNSERAGASYHGRVHSFNPQPLPSGAHRFPYSIFHNPANSRRRMLAILRGSLF